MSGTADAGGGDSPGTSDTPDTPDDSSGASED